jgi:DNA-binding transcriptional MocR family regulator
LWIQFPKEVDTVRLYHEALKHKISIAPGILFSSTPRYNNCVRVNASPPWSDRIQAALRLLGKLAVIQLGRKAGKSAAQELFLPGKRAV